MNLTRLVVLAAFLGVGGCAGTFEDYESTYVFDTEHLKNGVASVEIVSVEHYNFVGDMMWHGYRYMVQNRSSSPLCVKVTLKNVYAGGWWYGDAITVPVSGYVKVAEIWSDPSVSVSSTGYNIEYRQVTSSSQCY